MPVTTAATAQVFEMHNARFTSLIRPSTGSTELCVWRVEVAPGTEGVAHRVLREEAFVVLSGGPTLTVEGVTTDLAVGDAALAPAGSTIRLSNLGEQPAVVLVTVPVGFTGELADGTVVNPPWVN
ncbi:cupin domain-containing protein [Nocardia huaxiensis]|uniref:Cupin domain-containing protein n=1 Tax=Nocardia huaxiensis TaxID=2755382 RepID=A0A7D6VA13_9NOCA|nr:cupin domain-containing protein [Nocardia huaxiensis]QLY30434.1 cupin domain-containing protein [Nocardia huaxiensis]UFS95968.1 cupin domain-containing protein [Nocardia huaxiensis]